MNVIKQLIRYFWVTVLMMPLLCLSCTEESGGVPSAMTDTTVQLDLELYIPAPSVATRVISTDNELYLDPTKFAVYAFDASDNYLWTIVSGGTNTDGTSQLAYTNGHLYVDAPEYNGTVQLLVLANVNDLSTAKGIAASTSSTTMSEIIENLSPALDYDVTDTSLTGIPMAGTATLSNITLGSRGAISLRRSVAKISVTYTDATQRGNFVPSSMQVVNVNRYATVYAPTGEINISTNENNTITTEETTFVANGDGTVTATIFVAETLNLPNDGSRISVLVNGTYTDDNNVSGSYWYRLDMITESTESTESTEENEIEYLMRNYHYKFTIADITYHGSSSVDEALAMDYPDNFILVTGDEAAYVVIVDDDILSISVEYDTSVDSDNPYYVGVSSTEVTITYDGDLADYDPIKVKVITNFDGWTIDESFLPTDSAGNCAFDFSYENEVENTVTMWIWVDYPDAIEQGKTYTYYIVAGNIRKEMKITII